MSRHDKPTSKISDGILEQFMASLPLASDPDKLQPVFQGHHYATYRTNGSPQGQYTQMSSRAKALAAPHPGLPLPVVKLFRDHEEAFIVLANGAHLMGEEQNMYLSTLSRHKHTIKLYQKGTLIFGSITFSQPLAAGIPGSNHERIDIPEKTEVKLLISGGPADVKTYTVHGRVVVDSYGIGGDLLLILKGNCVEELRAVVEPLPRRRKLPLEHCVSESKAAAAWFSMGGLLGFLGSWLSPHRLLSTFNKAEQTGTATEQIDESTDAIEPAKADDLAIPTEFIEFTEVVDSSEAIESTKSTWFLTSRLWNAFTDTNQITSSTKIVTKLSAVDVNNVLPRRNPENNEPWWVRATFNDDRTTKARINAVTCTYGTANKPGVPHFVPARIKWPALLNDGKRLKTVRPFAFVESERSMTLKFFQRHLKMLKSREWTPRQVKILNTMLHPEGGMLLVSGPPGSGKTMVMSHMIDFATSSGAKCLVWGMNNESLNTFCRAHIDHCPHGTRPIRYFSQAKPFIDTEGEHEIDPTEEDISLFEALVNAERAFDRPRTEAQDWTVETKVLQNMHDESRQPLHKHFVIGRDQNKQPIEAEEETDMYDHLFDCIKRSEKTPMSEWTKKEIAFYKQSVKHCRAHVIQETKFLVCTAVASATKECGENFASGPDDKVVGFVDEAQALNEPDTLIPLASTNYSRKLTGVYMFGDENQLGPFNMSKDGEDNTVNEFGSQMDVSLFDRLMYTGHPVLRLNQQSRQHPTLFEATNRNSYNKSVTTSARTDVPLQLHKDLLPQILGKKLTEKWDEYQLRNAWVILTNSELETHANSGSYANRAHASYVVNKVLPILRKTFGKDVYDKVLLVTPYTLQKKLYSIEYHRLQSEGWSTSELPKLATIDSSRGDQRKFVILDLVQQNRAGFMSKPGRTCVAFTRSEDWQLTISGPLDQIPRDTIIRMAVSLDDDQPPEFYEVLMPLLEHMEQAKSKKYLYHRVAKVTIPQDSKMRAPDTPLQDDTVGAAQPTDDLEWYTQQPLDDHEWYAAQAADNFAWDAAQSNNVSAGESTATTERPVPGQWPDEETVYDAGNDGWGHGEADAGNDG